MVSGIPLSPFGTHGVRSASERGQRFLSGFCEDRHPVPTWCQSNGVNPHDTASTPALPLSTHDAASPDSVSVNQHGLVPAVTLGLADRYAHRSPIAVMRVVHVLTMALMTVTVSRSVLLELTCDVPQLLA